MKMPKNQLNVVILTDLYRIEGTVHLLKNSRLSDLLNSEASKKDFLPVTDAAVYSRVDNTLLYSLDFLNVNREHITLLFVDKSSKVAVKTQLKSYRQMFNRKEYSKVYEELSNFINQNPDLVEAHYLLGLTCCKLNKFKEGVKAFQKVVELAPENSMIALEALEMINQIR